MNCENMNYEDMKVEGLRAECKKRGIKGYSRLRRHELIALLDNKEIIRNRTISKKERIALWNLYFGRDARTGNCYCCGDVIDFYTNYEAGHVVAHSKGGSDSIKNLRPICHSCNRSMGTENLEDFKKKINVKNNDILERDHNRLKINLTREILPKNVVNYLPCFSFISRPTTKIKIQLVIYDGRLFITLDDLAYILKRDHAIIIHKKNKIISTDLIDKLKLKVVSNKCYENEKIVTRYFVDWNEVEKFYESILKR